jgi:hypothetical protein
LIGAFGLEAPKDLLAFRQALAIQPVFFEMSGQRAGLDLARLDEVVRFHDLDDLSHTAARRFFFEGHGLLPSLSRDGAWLADIASGLGFEAVKTVALVCRQPFANGLFVNGVLFRMGDVVLLLRQSPLHFAFDAPFQFFLAEKRQNEAIAKQRDLFAFGFFHNLPPACPAKALGRPGLVEGTRRFFVLPAVNL